MSLEKQKSLKVNMILNVIKGVMSIIFPLITFPYASRILGVENIGRFNFANSIISYFILTAGLGISNYAIREGAVYRNHKSRLKHFSDEMFTINMISTIVSYLFLYLSIVVIPQFSGYFTLLVILSMQLIFKTIGIEWLYSIYEDYAYITVRSIAFQLLSLILLFAFVHDKKDIEIYAVIVVISGAGSGLMNYFHARKRIRVSLTREIDWKRHLRPILIMFAMSLTVTVYVSSDTTILGFLCGDRTVGIYSVSVKVYSIVKTILSSVLVVSIPRLSLLYGNKDILSFTETAKNIYKTLLTLVIPSIAGIIILRKQIILLISDAEYIDASSSLTLLAIALFMCMAAWFWGQCILVPMKREGEVFKITVVSALLNIGLNMLFIPTFKENAAAFTTILAEGCSYLWCMHKGRKISEVKGFSGTIMKVLVGVAGIWVVASILERFVYDDLTYTILTVICSAAVYGAIEILLKNDMIYSLVNNVKRKYKK